jgi:Bacterial Ig domain
VTVFLTDDGGTANGGQDTSATQTFAINVTPVNDAPSFTKGSDQAILEDAGEQTVSGWASNISAGPADESGQALTFLVTTDNDDMFSVKPSIDASGNLTYTTAANANGSATVTVRLMDDGGTANGGVDTSDPQTFTIDVAPVNDAPSFTKGSDQTSLEDAGAQSISGWATNVLAGPSDEAGQVLTFHVSTDNDALFSTLPSIDALGNLTYTSAANANGSATVTVFLTDDGGTANGGQDTSATQTFAINVTPVNDAPSFTKGSDQTILEDAGAQSISGWVTNISAGPADESGQSLSFLVTTNNDAIFSVKPAIDASGNLTYTPAANANGSATVTVRLMDDGGTANGGVDTSDAQTFTIDVTPVNDVPSFTKGSDQTSLEDAGAQSISGWATSISAGAANESDQILTFHVSTNNDALFSVLPAIDSSGKLTYTSAANANGSATVTVFLSDDGGTANGGQDTSATQSFTINVTSVNDAPVLDTTGTPVLPFTPVLGKVLPSGGAVSDLTRYVTDVDTGAVKGVAITAIDTAKGKWQFNLTGSDNGWTDISGVSASHALLLADDGNTLVRFVPNKGFTGFASITFKAWDQSNGASEGTFGDTTAVSDTSYSVASDRGWIAVGKTKVTINPDGATVLKPTLPVFKATSKAVALAPVMAKDLLGIAGLEAGVGPKIGFGVAILSADSTNGHWEYKRLKLDKSFQPIDLSGGKILLLRPTDQLRFVPTVTANGAAPLTFKTWDSTAGVGSAGPSNLSPTGVGFGVDPGTAVLGLTPVLNLTKPAILNPIDATHPPTSAMFSDFVAASRVVGTNLGVAITATKGTGVWEYSPNGSTWTPVGKVSVGKALFLDLTDLIRFTPTSNTIPQTASLSFKAWDMTKIATGLVGAASGTFVSRETEVVTVAVADQAPTLDTTPTVTLPSVSSSSKKPIAGVTVKTLLGKAFSDPAGTKTQGIAITLADNANGSWQYSLGANVWVNIGTVSDSSALLLADTARIRFVPNAGYTGSATIEYKAWDRSAGISGDRGVDTTGVFLNMFSTQVETASIAVTA